MSEPVVTVISVRGEAYLDVEPDTAELHATVRVFRATKADALSTVADRMTALIGALRGLGGVALSAAGTRPSLGWLAHSTSTWPEERFDKQGRPETGRMGGSTSVRIQVRDFTLLDRLTALLGTHDDFYVHHVGWSVDRDNPGWRVVRSAAIDAAVAKARDYAAALGGSLRRLEHVADTGLLGGAEGHGGYQSSSVAMAAGGGQEGMAPSLDPVPQELYAQIEARFSAAVAALGAR